MIFLLLIPHSLKLNRYVGRQTKISYLETHFLVNIKKILKILIFFSKLEAFVRPLHLELHLFQSVE